MPVSPRRRLALLASCSASVLLIGGVLTPTAAIADDEDHPQLLGLTHYTGELHSHTGLTYTEQGGNTPTDVWTYIQANSDLDFYAATEKAGQHGRQQRRRVHRRRLTRRSPPSGATCSPRRTPGTRRTTSWSACPARRSAGRTSPTDTSTCSTRSGCIDAQYLGAGWTESKVGQTEHDLLAFYARLKQDPDAIAQFNHPSPTGYGTFQDWHHLDPQLDAQIEMFEYKQNDAEYLQTWHDALDAGWHLAPTWNGDEHGKSFDDNPARTGIWATEHSLAGLYDAMHRRSLYASFDVDATLAMIANDKMMGSILPVHHDAGGRRGARRRPERRQPGRHHHDLRQRWRGAGHEGLHRARLRRAVHPRRRRRRLVLRAR